VIHIKKELRAKPAGTRGKVVAVVVVAVVMAVAMAVAMTVAMTVRLRALTRRAFHINAGAIWDGR